MIRGTINTDAERKYICDSGFTYTRLIQSVECNCRVILRNNALPLLYSSLQNNSIPMNLTLPFMLDQHKIVYTKVEKVQVFNFVFTNIDLKSVTYIYIQLPGVKNSCNNSCSKSLPFHSDTFIFPFFFAISWIECRESVNGSCNALHRYTVGITVKRKT